MMPDRFEHRRACAVAHGKQRYFVVEIDESLDDDSTRSRATALLGAMPCGIDLLAAADCALTVSRRTHYGFHHARYADFVDSSDEILVGVGETVGGCRQSEFLGGKTADALAVHREPCGVGGRDDVVALLFEFDERRCGDSLDLGDDVIGLFEFDYLAQFRSVEHRYYMGTVCDLHRRGVGVAVESHHFDSVTLQFDCDLLAEFACAAQQRLFAYRCKRSSDFYHNEKEYLDIGSVRKNNIGRRNGRPSAAKVIKSFHQSPRRTKCQNFQPLCQNEQPRTADDSLFL